MFPSRHWQPASSSPAASAIIVAIGVIFFGTVLGSLVVPAMPNNEYSRWVVALVFVVLTVVTLLVTARLVIARRRHEGRPMTRAARVSVAECGVAVVGAALASALSVASSWTILYKYSWDAGVVRTAVAHHDTPQSLIQWYFALYPNNLPFLGMARIIQRLGAHLGLSYATSFLVVNGLFLFITLASVWFAVRLYAGRLAAALCFGLVFVLVGLSPWMLVGYTDMPAMAFLTLAAAITMLAFRLPSNRRKLTAFAAAGVLLGISAAFKPMPLVLLVAVVMTIVVSRKEIFPETPRWSRVLTSVLVLAAACGLGYVGTSKPLIQASRTSRNDLRQTPAATQLTWVASGTSFQRIDGVNYYGGYDGPLVKKISGKPADEQNRMAWDEIQKYIDQRSLTGNVAFYLRKHLWNWGDGMFWAYGEGHDAHRPVLHPRTFTPQVTAWNRPDGAHWRLRSGLTTGLWLFLLAVMALSLFRARGAAVLYLALSCLGIAAFNDIFQARSRYVFAFVPLIAMLAVIAAGQLWSRQGEVENTDDHRQDASGATVAGP